MRTLRPYVVVFALFLTACGLSGLTAGNDAEQGDGSTQVGPQDGGATGGVSGDSNVVADGDVAASAALTCPPQVVPARDANYLAAAATIVLIPQANTGACIGLVGTSVGNVGYWSCTHDSVVAFTYTADHQFRHVGENRCLVATKRNAAAGTWVDKGDCRADDGNQIWDYQSNGALKNRATGLCMDANNGATSPGSPLKLAACSTARSQQWYRPVSLKATSATDTTTTTSTLVGAVAGGNGIAFARNDAQGVDPTVKDSTVQTGGNAVSVSTWLNPWSCLVANVTQAQQLAALSTGSIVVDRCTHDDASAFNYTGDHLLRHLGSKACLVAGKKLDICALDVSLANCDAQDANQLWDYYQGGLIKNRGTALCLNALHGDTKGGSAVLAPCEAVTSQQWNPPIGVADTDVDVFAGATTVRDRAALRVFVDDVSEVTDFWRQSFVSEYPDYLSRLRQAIVDDANVLYGSVSDMPKGRMHLRFLLTEEPNAALSYVSNFELGAKTTYYVGAYLNNNTNDFDGAMRHEITHFFQWGNEGARPGTPGWCIEGMADYVRIATGYRPLSERVKGGAYTDGYNNTAFFMVYLDKTYPGILRRLVSYLNVWNGQSDVWRDDWFVTQTKKDLSQLWSDYQRSF